MTQVGRVGATILNLHHCKRSVLLTAAGWFCQSPAASTSLWRCSCKCHCTFLSRLSLTILGNVIVADLFTARKIQRFSADALLFQLLVAYTMPRRQACRTSREVYPFPSHMLTLRRSCRLTLRRADQTGSGQSLAFDHFRRKGTLRSLSLLQGGKGTQALSYPYLLVLRPARGPVRVSGA